MLDYRAIVGASTSVYHFHTKVLDLVAYLYLGVGKEITYVTPRMKM